MNTSAESPKPLGRPRDVQTQVAVHSAALVLLQKLGYAAVTLEGIAAEAGVGKQTLYRWWDGKADIILEAFTSDALASVTIKPTGNWEADVEAFFTQNIRRFSLSPSGIVLKTLLAEALLDDRFADKFRATYLESRIEQLAEILKTRPAATDAGVEYAIEVAYGVVWYRLVSNKPLPRGLAKQLQQTIAALPA